MPRPNHVDNGPIKFIATMDCPNCGEPDGVTMSVNDFYEFENCKSCLYKWFERLNRNPSFSLRYYHKVRGSI